MIRLETCAAPGMATRHLLNAQAQPSAPVARLTRPGAGRPARGRRITLAAMLAGLACALASLAPARPLLIWNYSASVPIGLYRLDDRTPLPGDLAAIRPDGVIRDRLDASGFLKPGRLLLKPVAAGALACRGGADIVIDGRKVALAMERTAAGKVLPQWRGCARLGPDEYFVLAPSPGSFDSRYLGPIPARQILGTATPLMTFDAHPNGGR